MPKMKPIYPFALLCICALMVQSCCCGEDENDLIFEYSPAGVYIVNEGAWGQNNAGLSFYHPEQNQLFNDIYAAANNDSALGDVAQSMTVYQNFGFVVLNGSDKIEAINLSTAERRQTLHLPAGFSPRCLVFVNAQKAYLTSLYTASVMIIQVTSSNQLAPGATIPVGNNPEEIAVAMAKAYVANSGFGAGHTIAVIDIATDQPLKSIPVGDNPVHVQTDEHGRVLVICWGKYGETAGRLMVIDPFTDTVIDSLVANSNITELALNRHGTGYFLSGDGVVSFLTATYEIDRNPLIPGVFYALGVNPDTDDVYVSDAKDYQSRGEVSIYQPDGTLKAGPFQSGIVPGSFAFQ